MFRILKLLFLPALALCYITRHDGRIHGKFDVSLPGVYVDSTLMAALTGKNLTECMIECLVTPPCEFINFMTGGRWCELMTNLTDATRFNLADWSYYGTNQTTMDRGDYCQMFHPCELWKICLTTETHYTCTVNPHSLVSASAMVHCDKGDHIAPTFSIDGKTETIESCPYPSRYFMLDLGTRHTVDYIMTYFHVERTDLPVSDYDMEIRIGSSTTMAMNKVCAKENYFLVHNKTTRCTDQIPGQFAALSGKYVFMGYLKTPNLNLTVREIQVYSLP